MDKTTQDRIVTDAYRKYNLPSEGGQRIGYQEGATAENNRAQPAIDTLEQIANSPVPANVREMAEWIATARMLAITGIEQWNGAGKEETKPAKIETCGHCGNQPGSNYIGNQLYLCDECMEKHTEDCY